MTDTTGTSDHSSPLRELRERLVDVETQVRMHRQHGWRPDALRATVEEVSRLKTLADGLGPGFSAAIEPLRQALVAAISAPLMPSPDTADQLLSLAEASLAELPEVVSPASPDAPAQAPSAADEAPFRVLIVEDDRSQALFAQAILRGSGMRAEVITDPSEVIAALDTHDPELVLTDLHMPAMSGTELIALIRRHPHHLHIPVVFLTGDQDPEREVEVLEHGGDDFIVKPVRPRHLIAAVQNRIRRARALQRPAAAEPLAINARHPVTGLHTRPALIAILETALAEGGAGAAMMLEIGNEVALRNRYGFAGFERLMADACRVLADVAGEHPAARLSDNVFLFAALGVPDEALEPLARRLRDGLSQHEFRIGEERLRVRGSVGMARLADGGEDVHALLDATEAATRQAASTPLGLALHQPRQAHPEQARLLEDLRAALEAGTLALAYQPVVAVAGSEEPQFQVLLRLQDRHGALRNAADVLPVATRAGLLAEVDRAVLQQVVQVLHARQQAGRPLRLFVPQSVDTLLAPGFAEWLTQAVERTGIEPGSVVAELRQEDAIVHHATVRDACVAAHAHGMAFCLSHYHHSPEAARLVHELPLAYLKLSAAHARPPLSDAMRADLHAAIELARGSGLKVIGPQVEDPQAAATLWMMGIDYIQGNLVQKADQTPEFDFLHAVL